MAERSEFIKARVSQIEKIEFERVCDALGRRASDQLRELIANFVSEYQQRHEDLLRIEIWRPEGYDFGAWRVSIQQRGGGRKQTGVFPLPKLKHRLIVSDPEFRGVLSLGGGEVELGGCLAAGEWRGHLYSNGISESENPTSLQAVKDALYALLTPILTALPVQATEQAGKAKGEAK